MRDRETEQTRRTLALSNSKSEPNTYEKRRSPRKSRVSGSSFDDDRSFTISDDYVRFFLVIQ